MVQNSSANQWSWPACDNTDRGLWWVGKFWPHLKVFKFTIWKVVLVKYNALTLLFVECRFVVMIPNLKHNGVKKLILFSVSSVTQSCLILCNPTDCNMPGSPVLFTNSQSLLKLMSINSVMPLNHLILCHPLLFLPSIFPSIRVFFQWVSSSYQVAKELEFQLQHQSFQQSQESVLPMSE